MEVYRVRRLRVATAHECQPGISITYKVDGRIAKRRGDRNEEGRNIKMSRIGDFAYADDTAIIGDAEEIRHAEPLFVNTVSHFAGRVNEHKTEGLRVCDTAHAPYDVQGPGEASTVKHVGAILAERAGHTVTQIAQCVKGYNGSNRLRLHGLEVARYMPVEEISSCRFGFAF